MGCRHGVPNLRSQRPITATTQTHQGMPKDRALILPTVPDHLGQPMWTRRPRLTHTTSQGPLFPRGSHHHWHLLCTRAPTSRHSSANTLGPVHHMARTHQTDDKSKGRKKEGCMNKEFCAHTDVCPRASPRVALVGVRLFRHPDKGTPMIAVPPLSGCPLAKPATQHLRWPSDGKGITIGATVGIVMCQWGVAMMYRTSGHNGPSPQRHKPTKECQRIVPTSSQPSPTIWGNQCGLDDRD